MDHLFMLDLSDDVRGKPVQQEIQMLSELSANNTDNCYKPAWVVPKTKHHCFGRFGVVSGLLRLLIKTGCNFPNLLRTYYVVAT